jgi:hypothetical protein
MQSRTHDPTSPHATGSPPASASRPREAPARPFGESSAILRDEALWPEPWAHNCRVQVDLIERSACVAATTSPVNARRLAAISAIHTHLSAARSATRRRGSWIGRWRGPFDRWRGTSVEHTYRNIHAAKIFLVELLPQDDVDGLIAGAVARAATCLQAGDPRRQQIDRLAHEQRPHLRRAGLKRTLQIAYDASDDLHSRVRGFRNILLAASVTIAVFMIGLVVVVSSFPETMPLCFQPTITSNLSTQSLPQNTSAPARSVCPSGEDPAGGVIDASKRRPNPSDVKIVAGLGLLGGALASVLAIRKIRGTSTPYDIPLALALLKVPAGALTAVVGMLLLGGGFVPGLSELDSQRQILAYALLLGYAQQLATTFIDDRAQSLLHAVPSKDPEGKQPTSPIPVRPDLPPRRTPSPRRRTRRRRPARNRPRRPEDGGDTRPS